jgi:hypothetical protein
MTEPGPDRLVSSRSGLALAAVLALAWGAPAARAQTTLTGGVSQTEYTDEYSRTCEVQNKNNPYIGMNPFACHGEMAPTDSRGQCSLNIGTVWKKIGNSCYYCAPINPPIQGMVLPLDQVASAELQGWRCGGNQTDACTAICSGGSGYSPPPGVTVKGGGPGLPPAPRATQGGPPPGYAPQPGPPPVAGAANPCLPFGPGGYDYCANPSGTRLPPGCVCNGSSPAPARPASPPALPGGAVTSGDPDAPDTGAPGFVGSFPNTKNSLGSFCYTFLCENNIWNINPSPTSNPNSVGHSDPASGDVAIVYRKLNMPNGPWIPVHFAIYQGNGQFFQRNGSSSIEVVNSRFFQNFPNAIVRYVNRTTGK